MVVGASGFYKYEAFKLSSTPEVRIIAEKQPSNVFLLFIGIFYWGKMDIK